MPRRVNAILVALVALVMAASPVAAARLTGDVAPVRVTSIAAAPDGGWLASGVVAGPAWPGDGIVLRATPSDTTAWAAWTRGIALHSVAALPDGGALVGGSSGLIARLDGAGATAWASRVGVGTVDVRALSCSGWDCVAAGDAAGRGFVLRLDASTGAVVSEIDAAISAIYVIPTAVLLLPSGDTLVGCIIDDDRRVTSACARLDPTGSTLWARTISGPYDLDLPDIDTGNSIQALAAWPDGRILAVAETPYTEPIAVTLGSDGTPLAGLDYFSAPLARPRSAAIAPSGEVLVAGHPSRIARFDSALGTLDVVGVGDVDERHEARLVISTLGDAVVVSGPSVSRLALDLSPSDACTATVPGAFAHRHVAGPARAPAMTLEFPDRDVLGLGPVADPFTPACTSGPCLTPCERDCGNALDDDGDTLADCDDIDCARDSSCGASDPDGDGVPNSGDCRPGDASVTALPTGLATLRIRAIGTDPAFPIITWSDSLPPIDAVSAAADIVRGDLSELHADRDTSRGSCVARRQGGNAFWDGEGAWIPGSLWYLVRPWNACGPGPWESAALDAGFGGCP